MRKKHLFIILVLLLPNESVLGKSTKNHKKENKTTENNIRGRDKRFIRELDQSVLSNNPFEWGKDKNYFAKPINKNGIRNFEKEIDEYETFWKSRERRASYKPLSLQSGIERGEDDAPPFWGSRGKKNVVKLSPKFNFDEISFRNNRKKKNIDTISEYNAFWKQNVKRQVKNDEDPPFWGSRGKRDLVGLTPQNEFEDPLFWSSREQNSIDKGNENRYPHDEPFWGSRGKKANVGWFPVYGINDQSLNSREKNSIDKINEYELFLEKSGKRQYKNEDPPFWGSRGKRGEGELTSKYPIEIPLLSNKRKRKSINEFRDYKKILGKIGQGTQDDPPFWGSRGKKDIVHFTPKDNSQDHQFWSSSMKDTFNKGSEYETIREKNQRRQLNDEDTPFWGSRGKKKEIELTPHFYFENQPFSSYHKTNSIDKVCEYRPHWYIKRMQNYDDDDEPFWGSRGKKDKIDVSRQHGIDDPLFLSSQEQDNIDEIREYKLLLEKSGRRQYKNDDLPFWGSRGKKYELELTPHYNLDNAPLFSSREEKSLKKISDSKRLWQKSGRQQDKDDDPPFWGSRGKREMVKLTPQYNFLALPYLENINKMSQIKSFWKEIGRTQDIDDDSPFWGSRGKKDVAKLMHLYKIKEPTFNSEQELHNFNGTKDYKIFPGRNEIILINDEDELLSLNDRKIRPTFSNSHNKKILWGNRTVLGDLKVFRDSPETSDGQQPLWKSNGWRQNNNPFWGTRRRLTEIPVWGKHGKSNKYTRYWEAKGTNPFWGIRERRKAALKENIINAINNIEYDIENLARMRRSNDNSFWKNRGRDSELDSIFNDPVRNKGFYKPISKINTIGANLNLKPGEQNTVNEDKMYVEQPHYILIERSSRSSAEDDPFFISRGKKYTNLKLPESVRDRRGAIEELVKSVRNDPYYIARGKKDNKVMEFENSTILNEKLVKAKELICSALYLVDVKNDGHKSKRDVDDSERKRRNILKNLAAQLQMDPYFVSRGKRTGGTGENEHLEEFVKRVADMCN